MELMDCNTQWSNRPDDERFTSLTALHDHVSAQRGASRATVVSSRKLHAIPDGNKGLLIQGPSGHGFAPTHHAFGQLAQLGGAPASYLRTLPAPMAADCINYGLQVARDVEEVGVLLYKNGAPILRAATGPKYGRIWNSDIVAGLIRQFGDGTSGKFRVPGVWGKALEEVTKENTTLFAGDRDMFVFLADEANRIEMPDRRDGKTGSLARGFFVWNSEVGAATFGIKAFLFDFVCGNRIVWGARDVQQFTLRHTTTAPDRFIEEAAPILLSYANGSTQSIVQTLAAAKRERIDNVDAFLAKRFGARMAERVKAAHVADEGRPIETVWDVVTGATAHARSIKTQDARVEFEELAGDLLNAF